MIRPFGLAVVFLTRIPVPLRFDPQPQDWGWSVVFFPVVGFCIGLLLLGFYGLFGGADPDLLALLLLLAWTLTTGGLHLDGLADTADAWIGGYGDRERTLRIMKDSRSGPMAIMVITLLLLTKFAALQVVLEQQRWQAVLMAPVLGRAAIVVVLITTPYVRATGIGVAHAEYLPRSASIWILLGVAVMNAGLLGGEGVVALIVAIAVLLGLRHMLMARLGGATGDTLGAACELTEAVALLCLGLLVG